MPHELHQHIEDEMYSLENSLESARKSSYNVVLGNETSRTSGPLHSMNSKLNTPRYIEKGPFMIGN